MLFLVATPIGNLKDITFRALETLKSCDYILCEDTRHSKILLDHYKVKGNLKSYHKFNEAEREKALILDLKSGKKIALISDAGTPGIADPGQRLIVSCHQHGIPITAIPGASAFLLALTLSGFPNEKFQFCGFAPKKESERKEFYLDILFYPGTSIIYESPKRILKSLQCIDQINPSRPIAIARELTKIHEEVLLGSALDLIEKIRDKRELGEYVLLVSPCDSKDLERSMRLTPQEHVIEIEKTFNLTKKEAIQIVAKLRSVSKRELYQSFI